MTDLQKKIQEDYEISLKQRVIDLLDKSWEAHEAEVALPHSGEDGKPVIYADNVMMATISSRYYRAAYALVDWSLDDLLMQSDPERWRRYNILRKISYY